MVKVAQGVGRREAAMKRIVTGYLSVRTTAKPMGGRLFYQHPALVWCPSSLHDFSEPPAVLKHDELVGHHASLTTV
ncbi:hypothetical protein HCU01_40580 [Halomonas cupida]|uniref:Uncharacterized protein n=1 Tax=Halomonas cupida TaxID=44933 RepID=A0ABQ0WK33_9GAMM|nr:hypothetical protein HCU01_40580 [Halomonas cupida]